jgi:hypothetical protein
MDPQKGRQFIGGQQFVMCHFGCFHFQRRRFAFEPEVTIRADQLLIRVPEGMRLVKLDLGPIRTRWDGRGPRGRARIDQDWRFIAREKPRYFRPVDARELSMGRR